MNIYDELYKQLKHLVSTIPSCNFINYDEKKDAVQDVIEIIYKRIEDGKLSNDFNEIKGYSFVILNNYCKAHHKKLVKRETPVSEFWELEDDTITQEEIEYREYLRGLVNSYIQHHKYTPLEQKICEMILENHTDKEIREETGLVGKEVGKYRFRIKTKMKYDYRRPIKYIIRNKFNDKIAVPCFTLADAKTYLDHIPPRRVTYMASFGYISHDGYLIETLIRKKRKKKNE
jgi:DNA-directed RNA polymerase specialized sigma24 family protein